MDDMVIKNMKKEIKKIIARIILGIGFLTLIYFLLEDKAQEIGWGSIILGALIIGIGMFIGIKIFWTLLDWSFN